MSLFRQEELEETDAKNSKAHIESDRMTITVEGPPKAISEIIELLSKRTHETQNFLIRYKLRPDIIKLFKSLAFLIEYCKYSLIKTLIIKNSASWAQQHNCVFDLSNFIDSKKKCFNRDCNNNGSISCSHCAIATWCSSECLTSNFEEHSIYCKQGELFRIELLGDY
eukprot:TRINITY_DN1713_c0_g1_i4.p1 TRINITY_DN1713_c0_g1~~TRINITY_DN1713_c0_g1_i4.p1  ORF type:complete len:167 (-),score=67.23 TRINITY_DN1713_c0_g1_i4:361-861(-)